MPASRNKKATRKEKSSKKSPLIRRYSVPKRSVRDTDSERSARNKRRANKEPSPLSDARLSVELPIPCSEEEKKVQAHSEKGKVNPACVEKKKSMNISNNLLNSLVEKNLTAIPKKHKFYRDYAEEFFLKDVIPGVKSFQGVYPNAKRFSDERFYALMLDWF